MVAIVISFGQAYANAKSNNYNYNITAPTKFAHAHYTLNINNVTYSDSILHVLLYKIIFSYYYYYYELIIVSYILSLLSKLSLPLRDIHNVGGRFVIICHNMHGLPFWPQCILRALIFAVVASRTPTFESTVFTAKLALVGYPQCTVGGMGVFLKSFVTTCVA